jgi:putative nucleotidyltransferase with HDIG domain
MNKNSDAHINPFTGIWTLPQTIILFLVAFLSAMLIVFFFSAVGPFWVNNRLPDWQVGETAQFEIQAPREIRFVDQALTEARIEAAMQIVKPVFELDTSTNQRVIEQFDSIQQMIQRGFRREMEPEFIYNEIAVEWPETLSLEMVRELLDYAEDEEFWINLRLLLVQVLETGIFTIPDNVSLDNGVELVSRVDNRSSRVDLFPSNIIKWESLREDLLSFSYQIQLVPDSRGQYIRFLVQILRENTFFSTELTEQAKEEIRFSTPPFVVTLEKGQVVVPSNYTVTPEMRKKIIGLRSFLSRQNISSILGVGIFFAVLLLLVYLLLLRVKKRDYYSPKYFIVFFLFWLIHLGITAFLSQQSLFENTQLAIFVPTTLFVVLVTILSNEGTGALFAFFLTIPMLIIDRANPEFYITALLSGVAAPFLLRRLDQRMDLIRTALLLSLIQGGVYTLVALISNRSANDLGLWALGGALNGLIGGILVLGVIPILEYLLNSPTRFRLAELSDLNIPIFKRMLLLAPGTYNHSVNVANLAESASLALGINAILARVGAYYHDIGKIDQAEYFVENQKGPNKHDEIRPSLSATILKSHVKIGVEKARELGLPQRVVDIITQHHGRGLIEYFYNKALTEDGKAKKEEYSYPGPNPNFKESAVVMLADTVEAATRSLSKPSVAKLEKFIWELMIKRYEEGLLNESHLTFSDLDTIHRSFVQILAGQFHSRIKYPGQKENE